jgi:hypothetical protein
VRVFTGVILSDHAYEDAIGVQGGFKQIAQRVLALRVAKRRNRHEYRSCFGFVTCAIHIHGASAATVVTAAATATTTITSIRSS